VQASKIDEFNRLLQIARLQEETFLADSLEAFRAMDAEEPGMFTARDALMNRTGAWRFDRQMDDIRLVPDAERRAHKRGETPAEAQAVTEEANLLGQRLRDLREEWRARTREATQAIVREALERRAARRA